MKTLNLAIMRWLKCAALSALPLLGQPALAQAPSMQRWQFDYHATSIEVIVWYPTDQAPGKIDAGPFTLNSATNAPLPTERLPLVLISHGTGGSNIGHHPLAEALASQRTIVAALMHPGDNYTDRSLSADSRYFNERPNQLVAMLDALLADKQWGALIDHKKIGAVGHSIGGYTVAAMAGARPDREALVAHCTKHKDDPSCAFRDPTIGVSSPARETYTLGKDQSVQIAPPDRRVRSIALLAPMGSVIAANSMKDIKASVLIIGAEHDEVLTQKYHFDWLKSEAPEAQTSIAKGAGHYSFLPPINESFRASLGPVAQDPSGLNRTKFNETIGEQLVRWFSDTL